MTDAMVAIKGVKDGLLITLNEQEEWLLVTSDLAGRLDAQGSFYSGARVTVELGERPVPKDQLATLKALFERRNMQLYAVTSASATTIDAASALDLHAKQISTASASPAEGDLDQVAFNPEEDGTLGVMIRRTLRSGRMVKSEGHVVIFGDVNAGAEIIAGGDVIVWGRLRGNVHAGAYGDESAVICALDMSPTQLRIAGYIVTSPADKRHKPKPEIARIRNAQFVVETWD
jgi:septum site-determining protein MinC